MQLPGPPSLMLDARQSLALAAIMALPIEWRHGVFEQGLVIDPPVYIKNPNLIGSSAVTLHVPRNLVHGAQSLLEFTPDEREKHTDNFAVTFDVDSSQWQHGRTYWKVSNVFKDGQRLPFIFGRNREQALVALPEDPSQVA